MKRAVIGIGCLIVVLALAAFVLKEWMSSGELKVPERVPGVPNAATWVGEEWVTCSQDGDSPAELAANFMTM